LDVAGKLTGGAGDSVSNHQVSTRSSPNGNIFTSQFGTGAAGTPTLRQTISIKLSAQSPTAAALRAGNAASSLDAGDSEETNSSPRRTDLTSSADSSTSQSQVTR